MSVVAGGTTQYAYNAVGSKVGETKPNGVTTAYRFNAKNQLTGITHQKGDTVLLSCNYKLEKLKYKLYIDYLKPTLSRKGL